MSQIIQAYPKLVLISAMITGYTLCTTKNRVVAGRSTPTLSHQYETSNFKQTDLDMEHFTHIIRNWSYPY